MIVTPDMYSCLVFFLDIIDEMVYIEIDTALHPTNKNCLERHVSIHCFDLFHQSLL